MRITTARHLTPSAPWVPPRGTLTGAGDGDILKVIGAPPGPPPNPSVLTAVNTDNHALAKIGDWWRRDPSPGDLCDSYPRRGRRRDLAKGRIPDRKLVDRI